MIAQGLFTAAQKSRAIAPDSLRRVQGRASPTHRFVWYKAP